MTHPHAIRIRVAQAPRLYNTIGKKEKENSARKENASPPLEKMIYFALKMACTKLGVRIE
jgi:hypothetical protein